MNASFVGVHTVDTDTRIPRACRRCGIRRHVKAERGTALCRDCADVVALLDERERWTS
jgi:hypothetical protein